MGIYSLQELRAIAPPDLQDADPAILINEYSKANGLDPTQVAGYFGFNQSGGMASNRIAAGVDNYQASLYGLGGAVSRAVGADDVGQWMDRRRQANELNANMEIGRAKQLGAIESWGEVHGPGDFVNYTGGLAAQSLPYVGEAVVGGLTGGAALGGTAARLGLSRAAASTTGAVLASYPSSVGDILGNQREAGGENLGSAMVGGVPYAALNAFGVEGLAARGMRPLAMGEGRMARMATGAASTALGEGLGETGQEVINQGFGRMAVNPSETLFSDDAMNRYKESFIGGATLGGLMGGAGGFRAKPTVDQGPFDLTKTPEQQGEVRQLGYSPLAGTPIVFPDGSVALNSDQELQARYGQGMPAAEVPAMGVAETQQSAAPAPSPVFDEADRALMDRGVKPNKMRKDLFTELQASGLDPESESLSVFWTEMAQGRNAKAKNALAEAIIAAKKEQTNGTSSAPVAPVAASSAGASPNAVGGVVARGPVAPVNGAGGGVAVNPGAAATQAAPVVDTGVQPSTVVNTQQKADPFQVAPEVDENALEIARMTGNAGALEAAHEDSQGLRSDAQDVGTQDKDRIVQARFAGSKEAERDAKILSAYMTAMRNAPQGTKLQIQKAIGEQFGVTAERVRQVGNPQALAKAGEELGYSRDQVFEMFGVNDNAKGGSSELGQVQYKLDQLKKQYARAPKDAKQGIADEMARLSEQADRLQEKEELARSAAVSSGLKSAGVEFDENEGSGMGGLDEDRLWHEESTTGSNAANTILRIDAQITALREALDEYQAQGMTEVVQTINDRIAREQAKLDALLASVQEKPNAVQKQSAGALDVRQQAKDGQGVGKQNAQPEVTAGESLQTDSEKAGQAWDQVASEYPTAPKWADLTAEQRQDFIDYGEENWTPDDVKTELTKLASPSATKDAIVRASRRTISAVDQDGKNFDAVEAPLEKIAGHYRGIDLGIKHMQAMGHQNAVDAIESWMVTFSPVSWDAIYADVDGKRTVVFNGRAVMDVKVAAVSTMHEVGHAIDGVSSTGGEFSSDPTFNMRRKNGEVVAMKPGSVADELIEHYYTGDSGLSELLAYPLDASDEVNAKMGVDELREELFAQAWAFSNMSGGMEFLRENLPATAAFMEQVHEQSQAANYTRTAKGTTSANQSAKPGQVQDRTQAVGDVVRASRQAEVNVTPKAAQQSVSNLTRILKTYGSKALNTAMFSQDLFKRAADMGITAAKDLGALYQKRAALTGEIERKVIRIEQMFNRIEGDERQTANEFLRDMRFDKKWGFKPTWRTGKVEMDSALEARFDKLSPEAKAWVEAVFKHGDEMRTLKQEAVRNSFNSEYDARIAAAKGAGDTDKVATLEKQKEAELTRFKRLFAADERNPYAPVRRFGNWVVVGKSEEYLAAEEAGDKKKMAELETDADHYFVDFRENYGDALKLSQDLDASGLTATEPREKEDARNDMYGGLMQAFDSLRGNIDAAVGKATDPDEKKALAAAREAVVDLYLRSLADTSARKSELRFKGIAGDIDMLRSFSSQGRADAHFLAAATYNPQMTETITKMREQKGKRGNDTEKSMAFKEIMARHEQSMKYKDGGWFDAANKAAAVTSAWTLATSPMYYVQNLTQPAVISVPYMTGKHEYSSVWGQLLRAYHEMGPLLKSAKVGEGFDFSKVPEDVRDAVLELVNRGRIDIGMDTELGKVKLEGDTMASKVANRTSQFFRTLAQKAEAINRVSTAMAAYRLELKKTGDAQAALEYADQVLDKTHGDYTAANAPRLFNTPAGKVALQFRKFQLIQLSLLAKMTHDAFKGAKPAERAAARKMLAFTLGHTGVLAGVVGMPGFAAASFIISKLADLFGDDDEPYNLENELRKALGDGDFARIVMRGLPMAAGVDISSKVGMGTALSILPYSDMDMTRAGFNEMATGLTLGATGGLGARVWEALGKIKDGDYYRGLAGLMPKGLADAYRAAYEANNGLLRTNGDTLIGKDEIGTFDSFAKAIGLTTAKESERKFDSDVVYNTKKAFEDRTNHIKNQYVQARRNGDGEAINKALQAWQRLQQSRREAGFTVQPASTLLKAPMEQMKRDRNVSNGVQYDKNSRRMVLAQTAE